MSTQCWWTLWECRLVQSFWGAILQLSILKHSFLWTSNFTSSNLASKKFTFNTEKDVHKDVQCRVIDKREISLLGRMIHLVDFIMT